MEENVLIRREWPNTASVETSGRRTECSDRNDGTVHLHKSRMERVEERVGWEEWSHKAEECFTKPTA